MKFVISTVINGLLLTIDRCSLIYVTYMIAQESNQFLR